MGDRSSNPFQKRSASALTASAGVVASLTGIHLPLTVSVRLPRTLSASEQRQLLTHRLGRGVQAEVGLEIGERWLRIRSSGKREQVIPLQDVPVAIGKSLAQER